jgi:hypothetical protein
MKVVEGRGRVLLNLASLIRYLKTLESISCSNHFTQKITSYALHDIYVIVILLHARFAISLHRCRHLTTVCMCMCIYM